MKQAKGTHRSMGKKGGETAGLESGVASVEKYKATEGQTTCSGTQRAKAEKHGSIAMK